MIASTQVAVDAPDTETHRDEYWKTEVAIVNAKLARAIKTLKAVDIYLHMASPNKGEELRHIVQMTLADIKGDPNVHK